MDKQRVKNRSAKPSGVANRIAVVKRSAALQSGCHADVHVRIAPGMSENHGTCTRLIWPPKKSTVPHPFRRLYREMDGKAQHS
jgi:hypothetical protein